MNTLSVVKSKMIRLSLALILAMTLVLAGGEIKPVTAASAKAVSAGRYHACVITETGGVQCWGNNEYGQLGNGTYADSTTPVNVIGLGSWVIAIAAGEYHTCALTAIGTLKCWGRGDYGQLGNGMKTIGQNTPVTVGGLNDWVVAISAGRFHTCALKESGEMQCWGDNEYGQLGNGTNIESTIPVTVSGLNSGVVAISAGGAHSCSLTNVGNVQCWGRNNYGQLGNATNTDSISPVIVTDLSNEVIAISAGSYHTCALTNAGGVKCWGNGDFFQLGDGKNTLKQNTPVEVVGLSNGAIAITAGSQHTCALTETGNAKCWGYNAYGQLGNGNDQIGHIPVSVIGLNSTAVEIDATGTNTCVLTTAGEVQCWGQNQYGETGDGTTTERDKPLTVIGFSGLTLLEHDTQLNQRANAIDTSLANITTKLNSLDFANLDMAVSSRASQLSVDELSTSVGNIENLITTFDLTNLDATVSSRASQSSVDALSSSVGNVQVGVNELNSRMDAVEQSLDVIESKLTSCQVTIALILQGEGHNGNSLEFYIHTTQASERVDAESILVWVGGEQVNPDFTSILPGVTWVLVNGNWSDLKNQSLTVDVIAGGHTCSSMVVLGNN